MRSGSTKPLIALAANTSMVPAMMPPSRTATRKE
jgi:hypothetical protein